MNTQTSGFPSHFCPPGSGVDDCPPDNRTNNMTRSFLYTVLIFAAMCLVSYIVSA